VKQLPSSGTAVALVSYNLHIGKQPTTPDGELKNAELENFTLDIRLEFHYEFSAK
jgi:hypothetical protein